MSADFQATTTNDASDNNDLVSEKSEDNSVSLNTDTSSDRQTTSETLTSDEKRGTITKKIPLSEYATLQGILAHQVDEGAPCLKCGPEACSGLDLHFWKKVCKNCGCPRGAHKIERYIEEKKEVPKSILLQTADEDEEDYKELAIAAPPTKISIKGKADSLEAHRYNEEYLNSLREYYSAKKRHLNLPEDKKLTPEQILVLQEYINQSQGKQVVSPEVVETHLHLLAREQHLDNSNSSEEFNTEERLQFIQALQLANLNQGQLRNESPSPRLDMPRGKQYSGNQSDDSEETDSRSYSTSTDNSRTEYTYTDESRDLSTVNEEDEEETSEVQNKNNKNRHLMNIPSDKHYDDSTVEMIDRLAGNVNLQHYQRKLSSSDDSHASDTSPTSPPLKPVRRNPESFDDMTQGDIVDYYTTVSPSGDYPSIVKRKGSPGVWVPPGLDPVLVKQYLAALPEDKRPVNTLGVQWRIKQLQTQLPRYDHNINYCHEMPPEEQEELYLFVENRKEKAQGQGEVKAFKRKERKKCTKCGGLTECGIIADKVPGKVWHPGCFVCKTCDEILVDLIYFQYDGQLYCGRHHAELLRPRCHACDELIFGSEFITADGHEYHKEHFCCWECDTSLGGTKYVSYKGQPYCQTCYEKLFCSRCVTCKEPIGVGVPVYRHGPLRWHGNPNCYSCSFCKRSLVNRTFLPTERFVYCSKNCFKCHENLRKAKK